MLYSEFRDGNVPAAHEQLRVLKDSLRHLPDSVKRSRCGRIPQTIRKSCCSIAARQRPALWRDRVRDLRRRDRGSPRAVRTTPESAWKPLIRKTDGQPQHTDQEWAEVVYVPNWAGHSRNRADYRFLAIRERLTPTGAGRRGEAAVSNAGLSPEGGSQTLWPRDQPQGSGRRRDLVVARALRQERGSPFGDEIRPGRRTDALWAVRRQRRLF